MRNLPEPLTIQTVGPFTVIAAGTPGAPDAFVARIEPSAADPVAMLRAAFGRDYQGCTPDPVPLFDAQAGLVYLGGTVRHGGTTIWIGQAFDPGQIPDRLVATEVVAAIVKRHFAPSRA